MSLPVRSKRLLDAVLLHHMEATYHNSPMPPEFQQENLTERSGRPKCYQQRAVRRSRQHLKLQEIVALTGDGLSGSATTLFWA